MAINANREQKRLASTQELLKKNPEDPVLQQYVKNGEAALAKQEASYPRLLKRHLLKCRAHGWVDARLNNKK